MTPPVDEALTAFLHAQMPFAETLGIQAVSADPARVVGTCDWRGDRCTNATVMHGGYLMAVADSLGATCALLNLPDGATTTTIESKTNFFRPVTSGAVEVVATPVNVGRTVIVVQTDITDDEGRLVSRTTQTQAVRTDA